MMEQVQELLVLFEDIKSEVKRRDPILYERWKAGGFLIDSNIISMYPNLEEVADQLGDVEEFDEDKSEDDLG